MKERQKEAAEPRPPKCPHYKPYWLGICAGHQIPYVPNSTEKNDYCFAQEYHACPIYSQGVSRPPEQ